ncbi:hypothetical protein EC988_004414 [Linderina pennispora]|nr:hypothetical protein EC988_004414 [Linderina pennispora]
MRLPCKLLALTSLLMQSTWSARIRKDVVEIENDTVVLVDATSTIDSSAGRIEYLAFSSPSTPDGTKGVVYALADIPKCKPEKRDEAYLAAAYIRIALLSDQLNCPIEIQIAQAQFDGAVGAIVYNTSMGVQDLGAFLSARLIKERPLIPLMLTDRNYGTILRSEIDSLQDEAMYDPIGRTRAIFASLYGDEEGDKLTGWEISLITLVVILALCFCTSLTFHVSSSRRRRAAHAQRDESAAGLNKQIQTLPACALDRLALREVTEQDVQVLSECAAPLASMLSADIAYTVRSRPTTNCSHASQHAAKCSEAEKQGSIADAASEKTCENEVDEADSILKGCISTCIVCIDDFVVGSRMRILPCGHNYHIECIDPWLTSKSSLCPLCKYDTRDVLTELEKSHVGQNAMANELGFEDIIGRTYATSSDASSYLNTSRVSPAEAAAMAINGSDVSGQPSDRASRPFENTSAILAASQPISYVMDIEEDPDLFEVSRYIDDNAVIEIETKDPERSPIMPSSNLPAATPAMSAPSRATGKSRGHSHAVDVDCVDASGKKQLYGLVETDLNSTDLPKFMDHPSSF